MTPIKEAIDTMKQNGLKETDKRREMLSILLEQEGYLSAREVQEKLQTKFPSISQDTIYRNLNLFSDLGIVESTELNGEKHYQFSCKHQGHHHHFICSNCGKTIPFDMCPMDFFKDQLPGYSILSHRFELFGLCDECSEKE